MADGRTRHEAAYSTTGKRKAPLAWVPWAGLLLLLLLAALVFLIVRNVGDDDDASVEVRHVPAAADEIAAGRAALDAVGAPAAAARNAAADGAPEISPAGALSQ